MSNAGDVEFGTEIGPALGAPLSDLALDQMFRAARTRYAWRDKPVPEILIRAAYDLAKMGPTSVNCSPARFVFIGTPAAKEKLRPLLNAGNVEKTMTAPWTVIFAVDHAFYDKLPVLFPHSPDMKNRMSSPDTARDHGERNGTLQAAYFMLAARALGLDCGPMSGFDRAGVDAAFFAGNEETQNWRSNFLCNIGYGTDEKMNPRLPRLEFDDSCRIL